MINTPYPEDQYAISRRPTRRIEDIEGEYSGRYQTWSLLQETPNTPYPIPWIRRRYSVSVPVLTKDHKGNLFNTPYPEKPDTPYWRYSM
ncbi:hypothetical protein Tco_1289438 [Tanacetum coccineum]